ncbi:type IVB secretion system protein IcmN/DotK [Legionella londiniensis]|uniref:LphA (DotK) n=1 Tax=Legionella londiniensis TaxID=45068 RepID=A0A0W0VLS5_9GAMM|nr:type IVB secretion system protein IcmN/DotK [Legionella londiniensis]KTD21066.1 LphA (DotK) [Legionella londiniensis]STX93642.1 LphA (DotK) [Legionella londiniensis]
MMLMIFVVLSGCRSASLPAANDKAALPYKVAGAYDEAIMEMQDQFNKQGIRVITLGQDYLISIPADRLFATQSPRLRWDSYGLLNNVACYLRQFRKISVTVSAYSSKCVSPQRERALTLARARAVGNYLRTQNIDSRFIFTHGHGSDKPILCLREGGDSSANARIEITFRNAVA